MGFDSPAPRTMMPNSVSTPMILRRATVGRYPPVPLAPAHVQRTSRHPSHGEPGLIFNTEALGRPSARSALDVGEDRGVAAQLGPDAADLPGPARLRRHDDGVVVGLGDSQHPGGLA